MRQMVMGFAAFVLVSSTCLAAAGQDSKVSQAPAIQLPNDGDDYSRLAAQAASRDPATDFRALRFAWLDSKARGRNQGSVRPKMAALQEATRTDNKELVRDRAIAVLSDEYVNISAQGYLLAACDMLHDAPCAEQATFAGRGLVQSILKSGDGKTCDTGWEVAMVEEEYFVLRIMGARFKQQALIMGRDGGHSCDAMTVTGEDGKDIVHYFTIDRVLADERKMLGFK